MFTPVKFVRHFDKYFPGDIAGFAEKRAAALVKGGVAVAVDAKKPAQPAQAKKSDTKD